MKANINMHKPNENIFLVSYVEERPWWSVNKPQQRKKEESERRRGERNMSKINSIISEELQG